MTNTLGLRLREDRPATIEEHRKLRDDIDSLRKEVNALRKGMEEYPCTGSVRHAAAIRCYRRKRRRLRNYAKSSGTCSRAIWHHSPATRTN